jgi:hypothetical protein
MKRLIIYLVLISSFTLSCQKLLFNEDESTRDLYLGDFHAMKITGIYNILLIQDSTNRLVITGKNKINSVDVTIINDTLVINDPKKLSFNPNKNTLAIHFSNLNYMVTYDPVNVSNEDTIKADQFVFAAIGEIAEVKMVIDCRSFYIVNSSNTLGFFHFNGRAENCTFYNRYGSSIFADSLTCKNAEIINASVGVVNVNASEHINAYIFGKGNIYYHGNPVIDIVEKRGDGKIIRLD